MDRIATLARMAEARPGDPFPAYGLAMEYKRLGQLDRARAAFTDLIARHPDYVPAYLMAGNLALELSDRTGAAELFERGADVARRAGEDHALSELLAARAGLA